MPVQSVRRNPFARAVIAATGIGAMLAGLEAARVRAEQTTSPLPPTTEHASRAYAADVTLRHSRVTAAGMPRRTHVPVVTLHVERTRSPRGWTTTTTLTNVEGSSAPSLAGTALENPFLVSRMEYDEDGTAPRLYNRRGERIFTPQDHDRAMFGVPAAQSVLAGWTPGGRPSDVIAALASDSWAAEAASPGLVVARQRAIEATFGPPVERRDGVTRHVLSNRDEMTEILVEAETAQPLEITTTRGGMLASRTTMRDDRDTRGALVRRRVRAERPAPDASGDRTVLDIDIATGGGAR